LTFPNGSNQITAYTGSAQNIASEDAVNIDINLTDSTLRRWRFGEDGDTVFPNNVSINYSGGNIQFPRIIADSGKAFSVQAQGTSGSAALSWTVNPDAAGQYAAVSVSRAGGDNLAKVVIQAQSNSGDVGTAKTWKFDEAGILSLPNNGKIASGVSTAQVGSTTTIALNDQGTNQAYDVTYLGIAWTGNEAVFTTYAAGSTITFANGDVRTINDIQKNELVGFPGEFVIDIYWSASRANLTAFPITLKTANYAAAYTAPEWQFGTDGLLTLPGDIRSEGAVNIDINLSDSTLRRWRFGEDGDLETPGGIQVAGILKIDDGVHEKLQTKADATGTVTHDCSLGHIFYHTSPDANWTANFLNLNLSSGYATSVTLVIEQGATGYYPSAVRINYMVHNIKWQGNSTPTPSTNRTDVVTFSIICTATDTYTVLGQLTGF
jgi:hypothetical protein